METKQFKPFERIIYKEKLFNSCRWHCAFFSDYNESNGCISFADGKLYHYTKIDILPYEGNEHLVGTTDEPEEEIKLKKGELLVYFEEIKYFEKQYMFLARFEGVTENEIILDVDFNKKWAFAIRFSDFNPNDMEETKKHILCVKNGKIVKYKD